MFGFTRNWFESFWRYKVMGTKRIKLAVVGTPSSGKSYLLYDIVQTLDTIGTRQTLPLSFPYSGFAKYITDIYSQNGCVAGTKIYACRQENHYGAMYCELTQGDKKLDIEFLNIPGEVFSENQQSISVFFSLKKALEKTGKGIFTVTQWKSIGGEVRYVVEPTAKVRSSLNLPEIDRTANKPVNEEADKIIYGNWDVIFSKLNQMQFHEAPETRIDVTGKYLMKHFYEFVPDSLMQSIKDAWSAFAPGNIEVTREYFIGNNLDRNFYFCKYCQDATDLIICDKLFAQGDTVSPQEQLASQNFLFMTKLLQDFLLESKTKPNVYLAFRGADMMIKSDVVKDLYAKLAPYHGMRDNIIYSCLMHRIYDYMKPGYEHLPIGRWIGVRTDEEMKDLPTDILEAEEMTSLANLSVDQHIKNRMGNLGTGFWSLLSSVGNSRKVRGIMEQGMPIAPHVYFTATPIDDLYSIYEADKDFDNTRFIRFDGKRWVVFNTVTPLCFGTFQLCMDILVQNGISPNIFKCGELIKRLQRKLK